VRLPGRGVATETYARTPCTNVNLSLRRVPVNGLVWGGAVTDCGDWERERLAGGLARRAVRRFSAAGEPAGETIPPDSAATTPIAR